jgi:predicted dehydrogenase
MAQVKFAIVGCGRVSSRHVDALTNKVPGAKLVAVCDVVPEAAAKYAAVLKLPAFSSTAEMYRDADIDVVTIATPSGDHFKHAMEALAHDKHVVVEKPLSLRLDHVDALVAEARKRGRKLWVAFQNRYNPAVVKAREAVESGRLGKLVIGTVRVRWCREQNYYDQDNWHGTWAMDGGVISQQAIHHIDALRWLMGEVESVEGQCATRLVRMQCDDLCVASLRFRNGALGIIEAMTASRPRDIEASLSLMGEKGSIILGGLALNKIDFWDFSEAQPGDEWVPELFSHEVPNAYGYSHDVVYSRVVESVLHDAPVEISGEDGRPALEIIHAIYASHERGVRVMMKDNPVSSKLGIAPA